MHKKSLVAGASAALVLAGLAVTSPAAADPSFLPNNLPVSDPGRDVVGVGSDTTEIAMGNVAAQYSAGKTSGRLASFDAIKPNDPTQPLTVTLRQGSTAIPRPNGSGAGKALLYGGGNNPDVSFARSSSALNSTEAAAGLWAFPFAVDTLQMGVSGVATNAPANLTESQIVGIYNGTYTDWSQLGGKPGAIAPLIPQKGSGTRSFFESELKRMNGGTAVPYAGTVKETQEHSDKDIKGNPNAVAPFSAGRARLLGGTVRLETGYAARRAVYNVVREGDLANANIQKIFGSAGYLCSPNAQKAIMDGGLEQMATPTNGGACGEATQSASLNFKVAAPAPIGQKTVMITPTRILDTRTGIGAPKAAVGGQKTLGLQVTGRAGVPSSGVSAVILNVTTTGAAVQGYTTAWPSGQAKPGTSNVNFRAGETVPNQVIVKVGPDGKVNLSPSTTANLIVDVAGYYTNIADIKTFTPSRVLDTRATTRVPAGGTINVPVLGRAGVPTTNVDSVVMNVTAIGAKGTGYLTAFPTGAARPTASNVNYVAGDNKAGLVVGKVGANGMVSIYSSLSVDVAVDISGYYPTGGDYTALTPFRTLDQRPATTAQNGVTSIQVAGTKGVPTNAKAVMLNVTATGAAVPGAVTVWPSGVAKPLASVVNYPKSSAASNSVLVKIGTDGRVNLSPNSAVSLIADVQGYVS